MAWDKRLITPERVFELTRDWPLTATHELAELSQFEMEGGADALPDQWQINLRCRKDGQSVGMLADHTGALDTSIGDLASGVLRHMVMAHNVSLSAAPEPEVKPPWLG